MLGAWRDDSTLVVTLLDASGARTVLGDSQVSLRQDGEDLDGDGVSSPNPTLTLTLTLILPLPLPLHLTLTLTPTLT